MVPKFQAQRQQPYATAQALLLVEYAASHSEVPGMCDALGFGSLTTCLDDSLDSASPKLPTEIVSSCLSRCLFFFALSKQRIVNACCAKALQTFCMAFFVQVCLRACVRALVSACMLCLCACVLVVFLVCVSNELDTFNGCLSCSQICSCSTAHEEDSGHCFLCALLMFVTGFCEIYKRLLIGMIGICGHVPCDPCDAKESQSCHCDSQGVYGNFTHIVNPKSGKLLYHIPWTEPPQL